jgi:hypothetical protein
VFSNHFLINAKNKAKNKEHRENTRYNIFPQCVKRKKKKRKKSTYNFGTYKRMSLMSACWAGVRKLAAPPSGQATMGGPLLFGAGGAILCTGGVVMAVTATVGVGAFGGVTMFGVFAAGATGGGGGVVSGSIVALDCFAMGVA